MQVTKITSELEEMQSAIEPLLDNQPDPIPNAFYLGYLLAIKEILDFIKEEND